MKRFALLSAPYTILYQEGFRENDDDLLSGWAVEILEETEEYVYVKTHYGVRAYARPGLFRDISEETLRARMKTGKTLMVTANFIDIFEGPHQTTLKKATLPKGSFVEPVSEAENGFRLVRLADGTEGYAYGRHLSLRLDSDGFLFEEDGEAWLRNQPRPADRERFNRDVIAAAEEYKGCQYRWGGKSPYGVDCSGLVFMAFLKNGFIVPRVAKPKDTRGFTVVPFEQLEPGDMLHFASPGHIGLYIGEGRYIHSTGNPRFSGVTISSFREDDPLYLEGLRERIIRCDRI